MKVFGQYWFLQGLVTACMLFGISAACEDDAGCNKPKGVCTKGKCVCKPDFVGHSCANDNPCKSVTCGSHGKCEPDENDPQYGTCVCDIHYVGEKCETEGVCTKEGGCLHEGKCETSKTPTKCSCPKKYKGDHCENGGGTVKISAYLLGMTVFTFFVIL